MKLLAWSRDSPSFENVENVVKPPQNPTMRNREKDGEKFWKRFVTPHRIPIRRQPTTFMAKVPHGKPFPTCPMRSDIR
jgi:hypothetical protein